MRINHTLTLLLLLITSFTTSAINGTQEQINITHPDFPEPLTFNISLPAGYSEDKDRSYNLMFDFHPFADTYLRGMHDWMSHNGEWPWLKTIFVTPAAGNRVGMLFDESGKSTPLLDFFEQQLFPAVDKKYRTNGFRIISGFRVNGTIALSALINKPDLFNAYIAISPELKDDYVGIMSTAQQKLAKLNDKPRFLLLTHGSTIKEDHQQQDYRKLHNILKSSAPQQLEWHDKHYKDHYFMSLPLVSIISGIELLFDDVNSGLEATSPISKQGVAAIIKHYKYLSTEKYGFEVSPKDSINNLGFALLKTSPEKGLAVFRELVKQYPDDAYSHHNLAEAFASLGDYDNAVKHQRDAVKLADKMLTWHQKRQQKILEDYIAKSHNTSD
ncbi:alpha/beta hydrolase-fold protein [Neptunicella marina]|uniref:Tetratricopeptide repeat protein n=1 Tax=Neptunicella marina TaxID=2125989 RepID=A0A8J6LYA9_9ALTE|nr:alpha/beta hydrolase-fold protein [Neptunicella marina]MBC3766089.1 tetratricopeptide repeat protein [Neptunicella marina]